MHERRRGVTPTVIVNYPRRPFATLIAMPRGRGSTGYCLRRHYNSAATNIHAAYCHSLSLNGLPLASPVSVPVDPISRPLAHWLRCPATSPYPPGPVRNSAVGVSDLIPNSDHLSIVSLAECCLLIVLTLIQQSFTNSKTRYVRKNIRKIHAH